MQNVIALRKENIDLTEKRSPLSPIQVKKIADSGIKVVIEPWQQRHFPDSLYEQNRAQLSENLNEANIIFGVKEIPLDDLYPGKAHCFFSHTIKGQSYNMPLLQKILDIKATLLDYEKVTDEQSRRLIFFGPYAGLAGAINGLWLLGKKLTYEGIKNPFSIIKQAKEYNSLDDAKKAMAEVKAEIKKNGLPKQKHPWVIVITGGGTVSKGAQEIIDLLPVKEVSPAEFLQLQENRSFDMQQLYKVVIDVDYFVKPVDPNHKFDWQDYFDNPEKYQADFNRFIPDITLLINGIFWNTMYPKLVLKKDIQQLYKNEDQPNLRVIADITCDIEGSIEINVKTTKSDNPAYVYNPLDGSIKFGVEGKGPVVLAVDKLPSELPGEATTFFGNSLLPFIDGLAKTDFSLSFDKVNMPAEFKRAVIAHQGKLTPDFEYLYDFLKKI